MTVIMDGTEFITAATAAEQLLTTEMKILMLLRHNDLVGKFAEGCWFVTRGSVDAYRPGEPQPKKSSGCSTSCGSAHCGCH
jgi:hypothetical protein